MKNVSTDWRASHLSPVGSIPITAVEAGEPAAEAVRDLLAADILATINGYALTHALFAFATSSLYEDMSADGIVNVPDIVRTRGLVERHAVGLLRYLSIQDLFNEELGHVFRVTPRGRAVLSSAALGSVFLYAGGYGEAMARAGDLLRGTVTYGKEIKRDGFYVGTGANKISSAISDEVAFRVFEKRGVRTVADLGCGGGKFVIAFAQRDPRHRGIGVDLSREAVEAGRAAAAKAGVADRVSFVVGDAFDAELLSRTCADADSFFSFSMEHEFLRDGERGVLEHIDSMAATMPGKAYLLGEPMLHMTVADGQFYWVHVLSLQGMPRNITGWYELLSKLQRARLNEIFVPDHQKIGAFFDIRF